MKQNRYKKRIFDIIQIGNKGDLASRAFDIFLVVVICSNILSLVLETYEQLARYRGIFHVIETVTVAVFCIEYILRIWTADLLYPQYTRGKAVAHFLCSFDGVVDLLTILPFFFLTGFVVFRMLRVVRIFHLFRLNARYDSLHVITMVLKDKRNQLASSMFIILILMLAGSLCMYSAEHEAQPEQFSNAFSGIWWSVSTLLTVGYGDIYPVTIPGRVMAIVLAFLGVGAVAIPTGIISAGFVERYQRDQNLDYEPVDVDRIGEILVDEKSRFLGKTIGELTDNYDMRIYMVLRKEMTLVATNELVIVAGDVLIVQAGNLQKRRSGRGKAGKLSADRNGGE